MAKGLTVSLPDHAALGSSPKVARKLSDEKSLMLSSFEKMDGAN